MSETSLAWITGLIGLIRALIGGAVSFGAILIQSRIQDRRARLRAAVRALT